MLKPTQNNLDRLEQLFKELQYKVRYEKGNFRPGSCVILEAKVVVVNKFATLDVKLAALTEILGSVQVDESLLSESSLKFYQPLKQTKIEIEN